MENNAWGEDKASRGETSNLWGETDPRWGETVITCLDETPSIMGERVINKRTRTVKAPPKAWST
ncbi:hypothetical protein M3196_15665 [Fictibacillus nanhaiensis]|uniref:hypothetical protein n=1 Tax=Fictibacillus nanhaiensis TaxID=742169 RepID=UPI00203C0CC3|nr:hypothetical protein [Fictibacillus nanhaiensis]MCM3733090.1 hypothetical protein [Fictibacillus nanhaiensis]